MAGLIPGRVRSDMDGESNTRWRSCNLRSPAARTVCGRVSLGDEAAACITRMIGGNALGENEMRNVLSIIHAAFEKPDRIPHVAEGPVRNLILAATPGGCHRAGEPEAADRRDHGARSAQIGRHCNLERKLLCGHRSDTVRNKRMIQIESARAPFTSPRIAFQAVTALGRADAMGLLPADEHIETLDLPSFRRVVRHIHRAGIARNIQLELGDDLTNSVPGLERTLKHLNLALEESPAPEFEWNRLTEVLGRELLSRLLGISPSSVRRYKAAARTTPDDVADRLHFLSLIVGDLSGAYNEIGIRQWFERKRAQLDGRTPLDWLKARWKPTQPGPRRVQDLARALVASPAT